MIDLPLKDIHLPQSVVEVISLSLSTYLIIGFFLLIAILIIFLMKKKSKPTLKRQAIKNLEAIQKRFEEIKDPVVSLSEISIFLRRAVLSQSESHHAASLSGKAWLEILDEPLKSKEFSEGVGKILLNGPYQPSVDEKEVKKLLKLCFTWVGAL